MARLLLVIVSARIYHTIGICYYLYKTQTVDTIELLIEENEQPVIAWKIRKKTCNSTLCHR